MKPHLCVLLASCLSLAIVLLTCCTTNAQSTVGIGPSFKGPIGLQLYSLRAQFKTNVSGTLDEVQKMGFQYAELAGTYGVPPADFKAQLLAHGITPISAHFGYELYRDHLDDVVRDAEALGLQYAGCAWIPHNTGFDEKTCRDAIAVFNHAGEVLAQHNIKFFYHTHGYEFKTNADGTTLFDLMMAETNPKYVHYQMDIFWIVFPAQDPVKLLEKYKGRWELMHLKDMSKSVVTGSLSGGTSVTNDVPFGTGQIDLPAVLKTAQDVGIKWYFIEDESPTSEEQIPQSLKYLEQVTW